MIRDTKIIKYVWWFPPASGSHICTGITCWTRINLFYKSYNWMKKYSWFIIVSSALGVIQIRWVSAELKWHTCCHPWVVEKRSITANLDSTGKSCISIILKHPMWRPTLWSMNFHLKLIRTKANAQILEISWFATQKLLNMFDGAPRIRVPYLHRYYLLN